MFVGCFQQILSFLGVEDALGRGSFSISSVHCSFFDEELGGLLDEPLFLLVAFQVGELQSVEELVDLNHDFVLLAKGCCER